MVRSMYSGVTGMKAHQARMDVIGNNIANVNTYGFKGSRATFKDVYYQTLSGAVGATANQGGSNASQIGYGSQMGSVDIMMARSGFSMTDSGLDMAIAGEGFIQVQDPDGNIFYTRAGMLNVDPMGNLVDYNGNFVLGVSGNPLGKPPSNNKVTINIPSVSAAAGKSTDKINNMNVTITGSAANKDSNTKFTFITDDSLPLGRDVEAVVTAQGITVKLNPSATFGSVADLNTAINAAIVVGNEGSPHPGGNFTIAMDPDPFTGGKTLTGAEIVGANFGTKLGSVPTLSSTVFGGMNFTGEVDKDFNPATLTGTPPTAAFGAMKATYDAATGYTIEVEIGGTTYTGVIPPTANKAGKVELKGPAGTGSILMSHPGFEAMVKASPGGTGASFPDVTPNGGGTNPTTPGAAGAKPSTPSNDIGLKNGTFKLEGGTTGGEQTMGDLKSFTIGKDGIIEISHAQFGTKQVGRIDLVTFDNPAALSQEGSTYFSVSANSGKPKFASPGTEGSGQLIGGALELSNVDLSKEFADMITTQRGFQANSRIITVSDEMLSELVNLKR